MQKHPHRMKNRKVKSFPVLHRSNCKKPSSQALNINLTLNSNETLIFNENLIG